MTTKEFKKEFFKYYEKPTKEERKKSLIHEVKLKENYAKLIRFGKNDKTEQKRI